MTTYPRVVQTVTHPKKVGDFLLKAVMKKTSFLLLLVAFVLIAIVIRAAVIFIANDPFIDSPILSRLDLSFDSLQNKIYLVLFLAVILCLWRLCHIDQHPD